MSNEEPQATPITGGSMPAGAVISLDEQGRAATVGTELFALMIDDFGNLARGPSLGMHEVPATSFRRSSGAATGEVIS